MAHFATNWSAPVPTISTGKAIAPRTPVLHSGSVAWASTSDATVDAVTRPVAPRLLSLRDVRIFRSLATVAGLAIVVILIVRVGSDEALTATARGLGWRSLLVCLPFALIMAVDTLGWRYAFVYDRAPYLRLVAARVAVRP